MSHEEFVALYAEPRGHDWIVEGDQPLTNAALLALSEQLRGEAGSPRGPTPVAANYAEGGFDAAWSSSRKLSLTWCIGRIMPSPNVDAETHELNFTRTIETMEWATRAWERAGDVNFVHLVEFDSPASQGSGDCQPGENGIHFRVRTGPECIHGCAGGTEPQATPMFEWLDPEDVASPYHRIARTRTRHGIHARAFAVGARLDERELQLVERHPLAVRDAL